MPVPPDSPVVPSRHTVRRLLGLAWTYRLDCLAALSLQTLLVMLSIAGLGISGLAIDVIRASLDPSVTPPRWPLGLHVPASWSHLQLVVAAGVLVLLVAIVRAGLTWLHAVRIGHLVQVKIVPVLRNQVYAKLQRLSFRFFDATASGPIINRVTGDVQNVRAFVDQVLLQGVALVLGLGLAVAYMAQKHLGLTLACVASAPLLAMASLRFSAQARPAYERSRDLLDGVVTVIAETIAGIGVIKGFAREDERKRVFSDRSLELWQQQQALFAKVSTFAPVVDFLSQVNLVVLLGWGGQLVISGRLSLGDAIVFAGLLQQYAGQVANVANIVNSLAQSLISATRVFEILDRPIDTPNPDSPQVPDPFVPRIGLRGVDFAYTPRDPALFDVNLEVTEGSTVVLFGETGSGKSTLLSLLPRFYDASRGEVRVSGLDVKNVDLSTLRRHIGFMFQESVLFSTTVADNIRFGAPEATEAQIERAATLAAADAFIRRMPDGYESHLEEGGRNLSGGERQRLALARALLPDPAILLLDDPTAALDADTEREVIAALSRATVGRTTIIATHRLPLCQMADVIVVLERGRIVQQGSHAELAAREGPYARALALTHPEAAPPPPANHEVRA